MGEMSPKTLMGSSSLLIGALLTLAGCTGIPLQAVAVRGFELERYLGTWYEIARLDHPFERGLTNVTAHYELRPDGGVKVINRGFDPDDGEWQQSEGKAYFVEEPDVGRLKVSFFGPFYGAYNIIELDREGYQWAMVVGPNTSYLWILSREPTLDENVTDRLLAMAEDLGFDIGKLIWVSHQPVE